MNHPTKPITEILKIGEDLELNKLIKHVLEHVDHTIKLTEEQENDLLNQLKVLEPEEKVSSTEAHKIAQGINETSIATCST